MKRRVGDAGLRIALYAVGLAALAGIGVGTLRLPSPGLNPAPKPYRPSDYTLSLERGVCFGPCPIFTLTVQGDGQAVLEGHGYRRDDPAHLLVPWRMARPIDPANHLRLIATAEEGDFRQLDHDYSLMMTDLPTTTIALRSPHGAATTRVYGVPCESQARKMSAGERKEWGIDRPVPDVFCKMENLLDAVACDVFQKAQSRDNTILVQFPPRCPP